MILRLQVSTLGDTLFPRDRMVITPHFETTGPSTDADALCQDLADALYDWMNDKREVAVKAYDAQGAEPNYPIGEGIAGNTQSPISTCPREVALCLSFFSARNIPSWRGRLFIPATWHGGDVAVRPAPGLMTHIGAMATILSDLGGIDVDWVVYSRKNNVARPVSNWWVDDEWDTIRSRGLRSTARIQGTVNE